MSATWRDRIAAARARGRWVPTPLRALIGSLGFVFFDRPWPFTRHDLDAWRHVRTCLAGEVATTHALRWPRDVELFQIGATALHPMVSGDPDGVERVLDALEDRALKLKREATS